jgi:hypothetical protein
VKFAQLAQVGGHGEEEQTLGDREGDLTEAHRLPGGAD